jgi:hypothetical protein
MPLTAGTAGALAAELTKHPASSARPGCGISNRLSTITARENEDALQAVMRSTPVYGCRPVQAAASVTRTRFADTQIDLFCMATENAMENPRAAPNGGLARVKH